jgi:hypothetical protein
MSLDEIKLQGNVQSSKSDSIELVTISILAIGTLAFIVSLLN